MIAVAFVLAPPSEAEKRLIFESIVAFFIYRILRYGVSWNLIAYDAPKFRLLNLSDVEASKMAPNLVDIGNYCPRRKSCSTVSDFD